MSRPELIAALAGQIAGVHRPHPVRVAIDGVDASGKTTLADELVQPIRGLGREVIRASVDRFHHPREIRIRRGERSPEGYFRDSFDYGGLGRALLEPLGPGGSRRYRVATHDHRTDEVVDAAPQQAVEDAVLLFDGVFLLRPELRTHWEFAIFLRAGFDVTVARAEARDRELFGSAAQVRRRYEERYVPGQRLYLSEVEPERFASVVIDNEDPARPVVVCGIAGPGTEATEPPGRREPS
jgi:uridine kinase